MSQTLFDFVMLLADVSRAWRARLDERLKPLGLSQAKWRALFYLSLQDGLSQRELSERLGIEGPTLVGLLDRLSRDGYIERRDADHDRRCKRVHLLPKATASLTEINRVAAQMRREMLGGLPAEDLRIASAVLARIQQKLEA